MYYGAGSRRPRGMKLIAGEADTSCVRRMPSLSSSLLLLEVGTIARADLSLFVATTTPHLGPAAGRGPTACRRALPQSASGCLRMAAASLRLPAAGWRDRIFTCMMHSPKPL